MYYMETHKNITNCTGVLNIYNWTHKNSILNQSKSTPSVCAWSCLCTLYSGSKILPLRCGCVTQLARFGNMRGAAGARGSSTCRRGPSTLRRRFGGFQPLPWCFCLTLPEIFPVLQNIVFMHLYITNWGFHGGSRR